MFEEQKVVTTLGDKINELITRYESECETNKSLRNELAAVKAQNEALNLQLAKLEEDITMKSLTEEDLFKQIEDVLAK
ncbi:MAG: hypothetical protein MR902_02575 [Campylobacter sp.]|nr:hypothetical protein [Campylobacter sp.]